VTLAEFTKLLDAATVASPHASRNNDIDARRVGAHSKFLERKGAHQTGVVGCPDLDHGRS
jgi:hypothetical protein